MLRPASSRYFLAFLLLSTATSGLIPPSLIRIKGQRPTAASLPSQNMPSKSAKINTTDRRILYPPRRPLLQSSSTTNNEINRYISSLNYAFPFLILSSSLIGLCTPSALSWVNHKDVIPYMLATAMFTTGLTLRASDFWRLLRNHPLSIPTGVLCQFLIMPTAAYIVGRAMFFPTSGALTVTTPSDLQKSLFTGLCLVGASAGGTASNLVALTARANTALTCLLTACSTLWSAFMTPLLVELLIGRPVQIHSMALVDATMRFVLLPIVVGMRLRLQLPKTVLEKVVPWLAPTASVVFVSLLCGGIMSQNASFLVKTGTRTCLLALASVALFHAVGFDAGYMLSRTVLLGSSPPDVSRAIALHVGMQNSALALVLARSLGAPSLVGLLPMLSAVAHSFWGSLLSAFWNWRDGREVESEDSRTEASDEEI